MKLEKGMKQGWGNHIFPQFVWSTLPRREVQFGSLEYAETGSQFVERWEELKLKVQKWQ